MRILFLGYTVSKSKADKLSGCSIAGNKMQLNILKNMNQMVDHLDSTCVYPVATFPRDKKAYYVAKRMMLSDGLSTYRIGFINLPVIKQIAQILGNIRFINAYLKKYPDTIILTFNMYPQVGVPAVWAKRRYGSKVASILADLPIDDNYNRKGIFGIGARIFYDITKKCIRSVDKAIVLNKYAWEIYAKQADCLVMDGGIDPAEYESFTDDKSADLPERRNIVYSGSLNDYSGIKELIEAVELVNADKSKETSASYGNVALGDCVELDIYGDGYLSDYVLSCCNDHIHYHGRVDNKEMMRIQRKAWLLANPRPVDDPIAMVTFPSKIFEYLMSGVPVLSTRLNGFSDEYNDLIFFTKDNSPNDLKQGILKVSHSNVSDIRQMTRKAKEYLIREKAWAKQWERIVEFLR